MDIKSKIQNQNSFTLVELLVVIGILAVLTAAVLVVINPVEYLKQTRDTTRMSDLSSINQALSVLESQGATSFGNANTVYISISNASSNCSGLGLPSLPSPWVYHCAPSTTLQSVNGTGWIPVDFTQSTALSFSALPIDPVNSTSTGQYYTYTPGGSWELDAILESNKYRSNTNITKSNLPGVFAKGTNLTLSPLYNTSGLVGYWPLNGGTSGSIANGSTAGLQDSSGNNNNGTASNANGTGMAWTTGKIGGAVSFDGVDDYMQAIMTVSSSDGTVSFWVLNPTAGATGGYLFQSNANVRTYFNFYNSNPNLWFYKGNPITGIGYATININSWNLLTLTWRNDFGTEKASSYVNGVPMATDVVFSDTTQGTEARIINSAQQSGGIIDDVRIYNRALSASEVSALYNATK